jgi:DNA-binding transcriptional LysR family regulator
VNVDAGIAQFVLTPRLEPFLTRYPDLSVEIAVRDRMGDLVSEGFDVAVRFGLPQPSALKSRLLMRTGVVTCASPEYVARHGTPTRPSDIEKHQCVLMRDHATGRHYDWEFVRGRKIVPVNASGQLLVNDAGAMLAACLGGQGIAQVLDLYARACDQGTPRSDPSDVGRRDVSALRVPPLRAAHVGEGSRVPRLRHRAYARAPDGYKCDPAWLGLPRTA